MKINYTLLILGFSFGYLSFSQQIPLDFSDNSDSFIPFFNSDFSFNTDPEDVNNDVGQFFNDGSNPWQGFYIELNEPIDLNEQQEITLSFYQFDPNTHTILVKLEDGTGVPVEVTQTTSNVGWKTDVSFNFINARVSGTNSVINATGSYNTLVIFIDGGAEVPGTYLIDDINNGIATTNPNQIDIIYTDLVWADEFDTPGVVDSNNWFHQTQVIIPGVGWANGEAQHYTNRTDNSFVDTDGFLNIVAKKEIYTDQNLEKDYTSARLNSKFAFTYGRVDVRAKLPSGNGTWPAIWMLGKNINENGGFWDNSFGTVNWPACGEIDIMEHGIYALNEIGAALHTTCCNSGNPNKGTVFASDVANNFHIYSVNWSPDQMTFLLDGEVFYVYNPSNKTDANWPFYTDQYLLLNVAMGGVSGEIDSNFVESSLVIDYVKIYQNTGLSIDEAFADTIGVYPNPATDMISINTNEDIERLELYNSLGQLITNKNYETKQLDVAGLKAGVYFLKIVSGSRSAIKKIIIN
jgi:beta-glucanase (GH16 family)